MTELGVQLLKAMRRKKVILDLSHMADKAVADAFAQWREARAPAPALPVDEIDRRIAARLSARKARNFAEADRIRDELAALGVVLKDSKDGTTWEMAR